MRWSTALGRLMGRKTREDEPHRVVPDSTAATSASAQQEARKGTAAADPVITVTPEGQVLAGAIVNGEFVESVDRAPTAPHDDDEKERQS